MSETDLRDDLARWVQDGWLRPLDAAFARFLQEKVPQAPSRAILAATLASHQLGRGHVCLDLAALADDAVFTLAIPSRDANGLPTPAGAAQGESLESWFAALSCPELVGQGEEGEAAPLVRRAHRLYLRRQWDNERAVRQGVLARVREVVLLAPEPVRALLDALFPSGEGDVWQRLACALALRRRFALITGGPGTGKTSTVVRLIALLQALALQGRIPGRGEAPLRIRLAAPTGKAAARLSESIGRSLERLPWEALPQGGRIRATLPQEVSTLHRLLGARAGSRRFRHDEADPLVLDVLVIDEASMVDLEMMAAVLRALPPAAQLVLLGDKDQLASVEAGAVLGGLCRRADEGHYTPETIAWLRATVGEELPEEFGVEEGEEPSGFIDFQGSALDQAIAMLRESHRFAAESAIGRLAAAVNRGDAAAARGVLGGPLAGDLDAPGEEGGEGRASSTPGHPRSEVALLVPQGQEDAALRRLVCGTQKNPAGYALYLQVLRAQRPLPEAPQAAWDDWARAVLAAYAGFQILCALREGPWGVGEMNRRIAHWLRRQGFLPDEEGWYEGRPVLMTRNAYALGLMNGDVGVTLALPGAEGQAPRLMVAFAAAGGLRWVLPARLPEVETVFALTVHKSQGSEFGHAVLVLPDTPSPLLTRELIYTGITRARSRFTLVDPSGGAMLEAAIARRVLRSSGLEAPLE
ncbi:exodeoxyribonuclease V subunit alpha [Tepidiphilus margaritifer]|uniref:exodeoxyribonuclease V subunit alpha n=1 Tax=Tepidiphilus margaritifer TaxID=203471 RepID=UPI00041C4867|nr:exodeoxyribonuclease V subunit alpha [Tepidiphilus margaritifer]